MKVIAFVVIRQQKLEMFWVGKLKSQEGFDVQLQGRARHGQLKAVDDVRVEDSQAAYTLSVDKDLCTATREKGGL